MKSFKSFSKQYDLQEQLLKRAAIAAALSGSAMAHAEHTVKKGDTLSALAQKHNTTAEELAKLNQIENPDLIRVGQVIKFPETTTKPKQETPAAKPAVTLSSSSNQETPDCYGELCSAIQQAETGSEKNPWIRTRFRPKGGSTAYGPGQITGQTLRDFRRRHAGEFTDVDDYMGNLISQSEQFARYGAEPNKKGYEARWDYGGTGDLTLKDPEKYLKVQRGVLRGMAKDIFGSIPETLSTEQREQLVTRYRGDTRQNDPRYFGVIDKAYSK